MSSRLKNIYAELKKQGLDGLFLSSPANITYLTDYTSRDSYFVISSKGNIYITDSRYTEEAKQGLKGIASIKKINGSVFKTIALACQELGLERIGFEERYLVFAEYDKVRECLDEGIELVATHGFVEELRQIKSKDELKKIKEAAQITFKAFDFIRDFISPGIKEIEIAAELERFIRYNGARAEAFEIIVASGANAAFPHHITSQRKLGNNEMVLIDMGVDFAGYKSDLTRTFFLGKITPLAREVYNAVKQAQEKGLRQIKPQVMAKRIDAAARNFIREKGYADFFGHNLGHGVGLEVHELPRISPREEALIQPGMVFTVEPGIYLPGKLGVRIEDMVVVTEKGAEVISGAID
mgnify:CR=1 FL=1